MITVLLVCLLLVSGLSCVWVSIAGLARMERKRDALQVYPKDSGD